MPSLEQGKAVPGDLMSPLSDEQREMIWDSLVDAEIHYHYFGALAERNSTRERWLAWVLGVSSSGTVASIFANYKQVASGLGLLVAILSTTQGTFKFGKSAELSASLQRRWGVAFAALQQLWALVQAGQIGGKEAMEEWSKQMELVGVLDEQASWQLRTDRKAMDASYDEVMLTRAPKPEVA